MSKIEVLKNGIDQNYVADPIEKLKNKMSKKDQPKFELKNVTQKAVEIALKKMKKNLSKEVKWLR